MIVKMNEEEFRKLETRVYAFSVDVFSLVKTLNENKLSSEQSRLLLNTANQLYTIILDVFDEEDENNINSIVLNRAEQLAQTCCNYLTQIEVGEKLLNKKVDLSIEASELGKVFRSYLYTS